MSANWWHDKQRADRDQRIRDAVAGLPVEARSDMEAVKAHIGQRLGSARMVRYYIMRAKEMDLLPVDLHGVSGLNGIIRHREFNEKVRRIFKDGIELDRPLITQLREKGIKAHSGNVAARARLLGLTPPDHVFPLHEPARLRAAPTPRAPRPSKSGALKERERKANLNLREKHRLPPNAVARPAATVDLGFSTGTRAKPAKHVVTRSALEGDAIRPRCPNSGCDWEGNTFRLRRHLADECPYRDEEDEAS